MIMEWANNRPPAELGGSHLNYPVDNFILVCYNILANQKGVVNYEN